MKMNKTLAYGLACLNRLSEGDERRWVDVKEIAQRENLPVAYANKVMRALVHVKLVESARGKGYRLARPLEDISVWEVMEAFTFNGAPKQDRKQLSGQLYASLQRQVNQWLEGITVGDVVAQMENTRAEEGHS